MRRALVLILCVALGACGASLPPAPADVAGEYTIYGGNPGGGTYEGSLTVAAGPPYRFTWRTGDASSGVAVGLGDTVAAAYGDAGCGVALYVLDADGRLDGVWAVDGVAGTGTETAIPDGRRPDLGGTYAVSGRNADGGSYEGLLTISPSGGRYAFAWQLTPPAEGVGLQRGRMVAVGYGGPGCGLALYRVAADGDLGGEWLLPGDERIGTERAVRR